MHIVLVDGSRTGLMFLHRMLSARGDEIVMFTDGQEALDYIKAESAVEVLITSFEVATVSGTELCWEARLIADAGRPFYVIAMSATDDAHHAIGVLDAGADDFMSKPPRLDELSARLRVAERTLAMQRRLIELATVDALSGLLNRGTFMERAERAVEDLGADEPFSLILFDIDHFKRINDLYGHAAGDAVIAQVGKMRIPPDSLFARVGGEEFAVVLPYSPLDAALSVAEHMRHQIAEGPFEVNGGVLPVTASFGVAERQPGETFHDLRRRADSALYFAKNSGRNRVAHLTATTVT